MLSVKSDGCYRPQPNQSRNVNETGNISESDMAQLRRNADVVSTTLNLMRRPTVSSASKLNMAR